MYVEASRVTHGTCEYLATFSLPEIKNVSDSDPPDMEMRLSLPAASQVN